jgi:hypothetical protein
MFHMRKNITCVLEQVEFHLEASKMNCNFFLNVENKHWQVPHQCDFQEVLQM